MEIVLDPLGPIWLSRFVTLKWSISGKETRVDPPATPVIPSSSHHSGKAVLRNRIASRDC